MIHLLKFQSAVLKESIDDLEWPGASIQIQLQPAPPSVIFKGEGHGDLQVCNELVSILQVASNCVHNSLLVTPFARLNSPTIQTPIL